LRTSRVNLIAVHNLRDTATQLPTLRELKQAGRIRYVGGVHPWRETEKQVKVLRGRTDARTTIPDL
jgi:aryl-alcohol dehydrogenase-like predicted oxidoreductase